MLKLKNVSPERYVPHFTPRLEEYNELLNQITKKTPTELPYSEKSNFWTLELGVQECINVPVWVYVVFQQSDRPHDQNLNNDTFYRMPVTSAQCIIGTGKNILTVVFY